MKFRLRTLATASLLLLFWGSAHAASLSSTVDRNQLNLNETITLTVRYDEQVNSSRLDLAQLTADFEVLGVNPQSSSSVSIANGKSARQASTVWTIILAPKRQGMLTIPALAIDNITSQAIKIEVGGSAQSAAGGPPLQVWVSASHESVYPSQQLLVEIELLAASDVSDLNGPQLIIADADVESLGQQNFQRIDNGVAKQVVILKYAVFAKQPGDLVIPVMTFTGVKGGRRSLFSSFAQRGQQVIARSLQLSVKVKAMPENSDSPWFPAEQVSIGSKWSADISQVKIGEPITRTISIIAQAQHASAIPPLNRMATLPGYKSYRDQPQLDDQATVAGIIGSRVESEAIVASVSGELSLPELKMRWWDVNKQAWQQAILPAETLTVSGSVNALQSSLPTPSLAPVIGVQTETETETGSQHIHLIWKLLVGLLAMICLLQFLIILRLKRQPSVTPPIHTSEATAWGRLQKSLQAGDAGAIRTALIAWAGIILADLQPASLQSLATKSGDSQLQEQLLMLDAHLYNNQADFNADQLASALHKLRQHQLKQGKSSAQGSSVLLPLYSKRVSN